MAGRRSGQPPCKDAVKKHVPPYGIEQAAAISDERKGRVKNLQQIERQVRRISGKRYMIYLAGIFVLSLGITLNTKTGFGVSPIISVPYSISVISGISLGTMTFACYALMVALQALLLGRGFRPYQLLQIPLSLVTSVFIELFNRALPMLEGMPGRLATLAAAIILTGIGASLMVGMKLVPNPADGLANVIGVKLGKGFGFGKNLFDFTSLAISICIGMAFTGGIVGVGLGTVCSMLFTGRVIALVQTHVDRIYVQITAGI